MFTKSKILGVNNGKLSVQRVPSHPISSARKVEASMMASDMMGGSTVNKSVNAFWQSNYQYMMTGIIPATPDLTDSQSLALFFRDMYLHDSVAGSAVDIQSTFPFSDWELRGLDAKDIQIYNDCLERLGLQELLSQISISYLTDGFFAGSLVFDPRQKQFMDILIHDALCCEIINSPFHNIDPTITVHTNGMTKFYLENPSEYAKAYLSAMPKQFLDLLKGDAFELDPVSTLYIARRQLTDRAYTSYLQRLLPMYLIEKVLFRGTLVEAQRRQRATTHIQAGDDLWTPTDDELHAITEMFQATEADPLGAWIATRNNIQVSEFRTAGDIWKWYETSESLTPMKLRALGISDAFLSGDACLTGDTLVSTSEGLKRIDSFGLSDNTDWKPCNIILNSRTGWQRAKAWRYSGIKQVYKLTCAGDLTIKATANHQFWVNNKQWVRLDQLRVGDYLTLDNHKTIELIGIAKCGHEKVYDFSMSEDPSFIANGLIVHNSYASSESAYSTFVETVDAYRTHLTNKIFYNKIFPLVAVVNELYVDGAEVPKNNSIAQFLFNANNKQVMRMPKLHWHKQLEVRDQQSQFDMLEKIAEHGIPVPLTTWIAAAGMDIEALLRDLEESVDLEQKLAKYKDSDVTEQNDEDYGMFASVSDDRTDDELDDPDTWTTQSMKSKWAKLRRKPLLARKFSDEDNAEWNIHSDGKRTLKVNQEASRKDRLWKLAKIISKYNSDPDYRYNIVQKNKSLGIDKLKGF